MLMNIPMVGQSGLPDEHIQQIHEVQEECKWVINGHKRS